MTAIPVQDRLSCPKCGWSNVRRSGRAGFKDWAAALVFLSPLRCRKCRLRYYRPWFVADRALPIFDKSELVPVKAGVVESNPVPVGPPRILLLDDDPPLRRLVTRLLHKEGYSVRETCDGDDALEDLRVARADLVLINLSAADAGEKAVRKLRAVYPELAIVVLAEGLRVEAETLFVLPKLSRPVVVVSFIGQVLEGISERAGAWG